MSFKSIGDLAISVLAKLDIEATEEGCAVEAHSLRPATGNRVATGHGEGTKPVAFAQVGGGTAAQTGMRKMAEPGSPAKLEVQEERQSEDRRANKGHSSTLRLIYSSKCLDTAQPTQRPTAVVSRHLVLVASH